MFSSSKSNAQKWAVKAKPSTPLSAESKKMLEEIEKSFDNECVMKLLGFWNGRTRSNNESYEVVLLFGGGGIATSSGRSFALGFLFVRGVFAPPTDSTLRTFPIELLFAGTRRLPILVSSDRNMKKEGRCHFVHTRKTIIGKFSILGTWDLGEKDGQTWVTG